MNAHQRRVERRRQERARRDLRAWLLTSGAPVRLVTRVKLEEAMADAALGAALIAKVMYTQVRAALASPRRYL